MLELRGGDIECHRYADCYKSFRGYNSTTQCRCVPGFAGDGVENCEPSGILLRIFPFCDTI